MNEGMMMGEPRKELIERFKVFDDSVMLAEKLYKLKHDYKAVITGDDKYYLMEARDNLLGLHDLCRSFLAVLKETARRDKAVLKQGIKPRGWTVPGTSIYTNRAEAERLARLGVTGKPETAEPLYDQAALAAVASGARPLE